MREGLPVPVHGFRPLPYPATDDLHADLARCHHDLNFDRHTLDALKRNCIDARYHEMAPTAVIAVRTALPDRAHNLAQR